ncbi:hypothetical protein ABMA28_016396 [Loxostege sticticalis]|uniref:SWIM-type domain-containing protein n=1 Tax=Loxostege sticticalis TaxID=481309 RepID=A0ABD0T9A8_LOXSC
MESGFVRGQSNNLPKVNMVMVLDFLANNPLYTSAEVRGVKLSTSARESYGDDAIGYVQVQRQGQECTVKARITPEHKVKSKPYRCTFVCNEETECIISVCCEDCAASLGGCKHAIALIMWLNRRTEEPSCTSVKCYWRKAKLSTVGSSLKFIKTADLVTPISKKAKTSKLNLPTSDGSFLKEIVEK